MEQQSNIWQEYECGVQDSNVERKPGSVAECMVTRVTMGCVSVANSDQVCNVFLVGGLPIALHTCLLRCSSTLPWVGLSWVALEWVGLGCN